jgi:4-amino-4-deoxy-L-arabinose transferase-like glycosyltransferase
MADVPDPTAASGPHPAPRTSPPAPGDRLVRVLRRLLLFAAISLVARGLSLAIPIIDKDEACYMVGAREMLRGGTLYVDFADQHPPGTYVFYAATEKLTGLGMLGVRLVAILLVVPLTALAASAFYRHDGRGRAAGLLYIIFGAAFVGHDMLSVNCELLMALPLAWAAVLLRDEEWSRRWTHAAAAGLLAGIAVVVKYQAGFWGPAFAFAILLAAWRRRELRFLPGRWLALVVACAVPLLATWAAYAARGAGPEFLYWNITCNLFYVGSPISPREAWGKAFSFLAPFLLVTAPLWWGWIHSLREGWREHATRFVALLVIVSVPPALLGLRFYPHYFVQLYWPLAVGAAPFAASLLAWPLRRAGVVAALYPTILWAGFTVGTAAKYLLQPGSMEETRPAYRDVATFLQADPCYAGANLFVWGYAPCFYYDAGLPIASRFVMTQTGLTGYVPGRTGDLVPGFDPATLILPEHWDLLMGDLARKLPTYILDTAPAGIRRWDHYPVAKFPRLAAFLADSYERIASVDKVAIYRRKGCGGSAPTGR